MPRLLNVVCALLSVCLVQPAFGQGREAWDQPGNAPAQGYPQGQGAGYPAQGYPSGAPQSSGYPSPAPSYTSASQPQAVANESRPAKGMSVAQWFHNYDQIRHQAQMSPAERQRADTMLSRGVSILMPGDEKEATKRLLQSMVGRYDRACQQLKQLPQLSQTAYLHRAYYNYFNIARQLFADYVRVQDNLLTPDAAGQPLATSLMQRKQNLEALEHECKQIDAQVRGQFGIAPYPW